MKHSMHTSNNITPHNSEVRSRNHLQSSYQAACSVIVTADQLHNKSVHTSTYCCVSAFSTMNMVKNKYRSTLTNGHLHQCLRLALTSLMPKFNAQKGVTFHTNKARQHHILCIVRTYLLEVCFWILTVTGPDPGLNGHLASGPFGFLIEYPWSRKS